MASLNHPSNGDNPIPDKEFDASINTCCWLAILPCTFGVIPYKTTLYLDSEEVTKTDVDLCGTHISKRPYGELGTVDRSNCCCFVSVHSSFGDLSPGCGCQEAAVDDMVSELKQRMRTRGDTAQIQRAEETMQRLDEIDSKVDTIMKHLNIPIPMKMNDRDS